MEHVGRMNPEGPLDEALDWVLREIGAETGTLHALKPDGALHLRSYAGSIPPPLLPIIRQIPVGKGMAGLAAERGVPVQVCNLQTDDSGDVRPGARATGMQGSICVPIHERGQLVGVLGVAVGGEREYSDAETSWLEEAGAALAPRLRAE